MLKVITNQLRAYYTRMSYSLFTVFFASYLFILGVSIFIGSLSYVKYAEIVKEQSGQYNYSMLEQAAVVVDGNLESVQQLMLNVSLDSRVQNFLFSKDLGSSEVLYNMSKTIESLTGYKNTNATIEEMYVYFRNIDSVLTHQTRYDTSQFYSNFIANNGGTYEEWKELFEKSRYMEYISSKNYVPGKSRNLLNCVSSLPINQRTDPLGTVVMSIDTEKLEEVLQNIELLSNGVVYILDSDDKVMMSLGEIRYIKTDLNKNLNADNKYFYDKISREEVIVSYVPSKINKWKYISVIPTRTLMEKVKRVRTITLLVILLELLVGLIISYLLARKNYKPFKAMVDDFIRRGRNSENSIKNETDFIQKVTSAALNENDNIKQAIEHQYPIIRNNALYQLINGNVGNSYTSLDSNGLCSLGIEFDSNKFCVINLHIDDCSEYRREESFEQRAMIKFVIENVVEELASAKYKAYSVNFDWDSIVLIINIPDEGGEDYLLDIANNAQSYVMEKFNAVISIGIGSVHEGLTGISESYRESIKALEYKLVRGPGSIIVYMDIFGKEVGYVYPVSLEAELLSYIKMGDTARVMTLINDVFEQNFSESNMSLEMARCLFFDIMSTALKLLREVELNYDIIFAKGFDPMKKLTSCSTAGEMRETIIYICKSICDFINVNKKSHNDELKEKILECIQSSYSDMNFSLSSVADLLKMNPSYLSYFFKEQFGENFVDYLNRLRLLKVKLLLKETDNNIDEIAGKVGYSSGGYLIRIFKRFENMTPGQYRKDFKIN